MAAVAAKRARSGSVAADDDDDDDIVVSRGHTYLLCAPEHRDSGGRIVVNDVTGRNPGDGSKYDDVDETIFAEVTFDRAFDYRAYLVSQDSAADTSKVFMGTFPSVGAAYSEWLKCLTVHTGKGPFVRSSGTGAFAKAVPLADGEEGQLERLIRRTGTTTTCAPLAMAVVDKAGAIVKCWRVGGYVFADRDFMTTGTERVELGSS